MKLSCPPGSLLYGSCLLFMLSACGCRKPLVITRPCLAIQEGRAVLGLRVLPADEEGEYLVYESAGADLATWKRTGSYKGRLVGLLASGSRLEQVFEDGTVVVLSNGRNQAELYGQQGSRLHLLHALRIDGVPHALGREGARALRLYRVQGLEWVPTGPRLPCLGRPVMARLVALGSTAVACWRVRLGGVIQPGLRCARLEPDAWRPLPSPPGATHGFYAVTGWSSTSRSAVQPARLLLLRMRDAGAGTATTSMQTLWLQQGVWSRAPGELRLREAPGAITGLDLGFTGAGAVAVVTGTFGARTFTCNDPRAGTWSTTGSPFSSRFATTYLWLALLLLSGLLLITLKRRQRSAAVAEISPGTLASPLDRAVAMFLDALLVMPLPVAYVAVNGGMDASALLVSEQPYLYWIWLGGLACYLAVAEGRWGTSVGKSLVGIEVRQVNGSRPVARQALVRNLARAVDFWPVVLGQVPIPYLVAMTCVLLSRRRQRLGDTLAGTVVNIHVPLSRRVFVLASASQRRRELFSRLGYSYKVMPADIAERIDLEQDAIGNAMRLAREKAERVAGRLVGPEIVIGADTLVELGDEVFGQPRNREDARRMLACLSASTHRVITAVTLIDRATGRVLAASEVTEVQMRALEPGEIEAYVASGEADGKAGAYAIQETGDRFITAVHGSLTNVIGLPMELLLRMLEEL